MYRIPEKVVFNKTWLVIASDPDPPKTPNVLFLFEKENDRWAFRQEIKGNDTHFGDNIVLTEDNYLFCCDPTAPSNPINRSILGKGEVYCYDLNVTPVQLIQTIIPPNEIKHSVKPFVIGFGFDMSVSNDVLLLKDSAAAFSPEEIQRYGLEKNKSYHQDSTPSRRTVLMYKRIGVQWYFDADLYHLLPHPSGDVLRDIQGYTIQFPSESPIFHKKNSTLAGNDVYLRGCESYYRFSRSNQDEWEYVQTLTPPFKLEDMYEEGRRIYFPYENITIGENYTGRILDNGSIDIYDTANLSSWTPLWNCFYIDEDVRNELYEYNPDHITVLSDMMIHNNIFVAVYRQPLAYHPNDPLYKRKNKGGIAIFEIDENSGPKKVFEMRAIDLDQLSTVTL